MLKVIQNKIKKNHKLLLYFLLLAILCMLLHSNLNSPEIVTFTPSEEENGNLMGNVLNSDNFSQSKKQSIESLTTTESTLPSTAKGSVSPKIIDSTVAVTTLATQSPRVIGRVHSHLWRPICTVDIPSLLMNPSFPLWPALRGQPEMPDELVSVTSDKWAVQRVLGLIYPPVSGKYKFKIYCDTLSEFWLSSSEDPQQAKLLARINRNILYVVEFEKGPLFQTSKSVYLQKGMAYFFDIIHGVNNAGSGIVKVRWMAPGSKSYTRIPKSSVSTFLKHDNNVNEETKKILLSSASIFHEEPVLKKVEPYKWKNHAFSKAFKPFSSFNRENLYTVKFSNRWKLMSVFRECEYSPSYTKKRVFKRYEGIRHTHYTDIFPYDESSGKWWSENAPNGKVESVSGNSEISEKDVIAIVKMFMDAVEDNFPGEYTLVNVINVERNVDKKRGNRFFLELLLIHTESGQLQRMSEYFFHFKNATALCRPEGVKWSPKATVNVILTSKNQGAWVVDYIKNMAEIVHATNDDKVNFIVVDFGNNGVNIAEEFKRYNISRFTVIKKEGKFHKTLGIDEAAKSIKDDNSIVFLNDLHLRTPYSIFENIRKHTIQGKVTYTPIVFRLSKCSLPDSYYNTSTASGYWESYGYGIFSTYKSDWKKFGGVNVTAFKHKWGGEDSEMVDRVLAKGLEIERIRLPYFYHFYHDKSGLWNDA